MQQGYVNARMADGGWTATLLNVVACIMLVVGIWFGLLSGFGIAVGLYLSIGALFLFAFASIVANLTKIVWILQRTKLTSTDSVAEARAVSSEPSADAY